MPVLIDLVAFALVGAGATAVVQGCLNERKRRLSLFEKFQPAPDHPATDSVADEAQEWLSRQ